jgi:5'-nucleotidase
MEDPIAVLKDAGYTNLVSEFQGELAYSYVFDGQVGYLDHALSNGNLAAQVTGATVWHINADEPDILDYDTSFKQDAQDALYESNAFRSSDHDPVIVGLALAGGAPIARCNGIDATIYVNDEGRIVGGPQDGRKYKGILRGTNGNDVIAGTSEQDVINGFKGDDIICGGPGEDRLRGGNGNDQLFGEAGDDWLDGGRNEDTCNGGPGENRGVRCELVSNIDTEDTSFTLTILHNNDGESQLVNAGQGLEDFGGIARFKTQVDKLRAAANDGDGDRGVVLLSSGDNYLAGPEFNASLDKGVPFYDSIAFNLIGYDAMAIGNHDFDFGPDVLANFITGITEFPFVSANLDFSLEPNLQALADEGQIVKSYILEVGGKDVGIVGATTPQISFISSPRNVIINEVAPAIQGEINALQREGVRMIIVISHLQSVNEDLALAAELKGVDVMIAGGGDEVLANPGDLLVPGDVIQGAYPLYATGKDGANIPVVTTAGDYKYVGKLTVSFDRRGRVKSIDTGSGPVRIAGGSNIDAVIPNADVQEAVVDPVQAYLNNLAITQIGTSQVALEGRRNPGVRSQETNLGSLMADSLLWQAQQLAGSFGQPVPDVALQNGGGIRNNNLLPAGPVTELTTFDIAPFDNKVVIVPNISRDQFKEIMENAYSQVENGSGRFAQVGGFNVVYSLSGTAQVLDATGNVTAPGSRIQSITLADGTPIVSGGAVVPGPDLTVATIDFLANGGDQYPFRGAPFTRLGVAYQQALSDYIQLGLGGLISSAQYTEVPVGGGTRIVATP